MASVGKFTFNTQIGDANFGKIEFEANTSYDGLNDTSDAEFRFKVVDPAGLTVRDYPVAADFTSVGPNGYEAAGETDIPLDSTGRDFLRGTYTLYIELITPTPDTIEYELEYSFEPPVTSEETNAEDADGEYFGVLTADVNCQTARVTFTDDSDYTGWTKDDRTITVMPPIIAGQNAPVAVESDNTADDDVAITFTWTNVTYTGTLEAQVSKTSDEDDLDAIVVDEVSSIIATAVADIRCGDLGFCDLLPCVDSLFNKAYNEACSNGGWSRVAPKTMADLNAANIMLDLYHKHLLCGNQSSAASYKLKFTAMLGDACDCGCGSTSASVEPRPYAP